MCGIISAHAFQITAAPSSQEVRQACTHKHLELLQPSTVPMAWLSTLTQQHLLRKAKLINQSHMCTAGRVLIHRVQARHASSHDLLQGMTAIHTPSPSTMALTHTCDPWLLLCTGRQATASSARTGSSAGAMHSTCDQGPSVRSLQACIWAATADRVTAVTAAHAAVQSEHSHWRMWALMLAVGELRWCGSCEDFIVEADCANETDCSWPGALRGCAWAGGCAESDRCEQAEMPLSASCWPISTSG